MRQTKTNSKRTIFSRIIIISFFSLLSGNLSAGGEEKEDSACDVERGKKIYQKCAVCHTLDSTGNHLAGPNLYQLIGRPVGKVDGFKFSRKLRKSEDTWTADHLDSFLESPLEFYPGIRMAFAGLRKAEDRADIICYLANDSIIKLD